MSKIKVLPNGKYLEHGKVVFFAVKSDVMYFPLSDSELGIVGYFPRTGLIEVYFNSDPPSTVDELEKLYGKNASKDDVPPWAHPVLAMEYDCLPNLMDFEKLSTLNDKEILEIIQNRRLSFNEYCDLTSVFCY